MHTSTQTDHFEMLNIDQPEVVSILHPDPANLHELHVRIEMASTM